MIATYAFFLSWSWRNDSHNVKLARHLVYYLLWLWELKELDAGGCVEQ
jgi:hypothetical protein